MSEIMEVMARGLQESDPEGCDEDWSYEPQATKLLAFLKQAGLVVVPAPWNVTESMIDAGILAMETEDAPAMIYSAMVEALNSPPARQ